MGRELYESDARARDMFERANDCLGFRITDIMFGEDADALQATEVTQPAVFLHSVVAAACKAPCAPDMVAGHSLGEFSALVAAGALDFEDGLRLVSKRACAMQRCCETVPGTMAAVLGGDAAVIEDVCASVAGTVIAANYNCDAQIVISGEADAVAEASALLLEKGARKVVLLKVGGAFHSPLMEPARVELAEAIDAVAMREPLCPIYQNVDALPHTDPAEIREGLLMQLTSPVLWTQSVRNMAADGATSFLEIGNGSVLRGLVKKIARGAELDGLC